MEETPRPLYHFTPPAGWMNDPNGLIFHAGKWHLFYQATPPGTRGKSWGHAVSADLVHWEHLPTALGPDALGEIWSGSAVADQRDTSSFFDGGSGGLVAVFTHAEVAPQSQSLAWSRDNGLTWTKHADNPVLTSGVKDFRDPKVFWHGPTGRWTMILATGRCASIYTSPDLKAWSLASTFDEGCPPAEAVYECPDLFPLPLPGGGEHWVLTASFISGTNFPHGICETWYWTGRFDGERFHPDADQPAGGTRTDHGPDNYAAVTWEDAPGGERVNIGWMARWIYAHKLPTTGWTGQMTVPRRLSLDMAGRLRQWPVAAVQNLRAGKRRWTEKLADAEAVEICADTGEAFEIVAEIRPGKARECGLRLRVGRGGEEATTVGYDAGALTLFVDRTHSGKVDFHPGFAGRYDAPLRLDGDGLIRLRIFVDRYSVEVFAQIGEVVLSALIFPAADSQRLEFYATEGAAMVNWLDLHRLRTTTVQLEL